MRNEIFVNVCPRETRVAVRESDQIVELHVERSAERGVVGGIYKGRVTRVLPGMQAAFVDIGLERAGFLYVSDYRSDLDDVDLDDDEGPRRRRSSGAAQRGAGPQIQNLVEAGQEILVQVAKEPLGTKGARITSRVSLAGRHLVLMPWVQRVGVSRRIGNDRERRRLRSIVEKLRPRELGFIVRTVSHGVGEADLKADIEYLANQWAEVQKRRETEETPALVYEEPPLHLRVLRDFVTHETRAVSIDEPVAYGEMQEFAQQFMAFRPKIVHHTGPDSLFDVHRIEQEVEEALERKVWLKSGGYLIIDQSEALTAIDVNTGRFTGGKSKNLEETILKTNLEAVREIVHQLRFRNIGGLIILDMIDMELMDNREKVYRAVLDALREDKGRVNVQKISELGLIEMTRKRTRENLIQQLCEPCSYCEGRGYVASARTVAYKILREIPKGSRYLHGESVLVAASPDVIEILTREESDTLEKLRTELGRPIELHPSGRLYREQFEITGAGRIREPATPEPPREEPVAEEPAAAEAGAEEPAKEDSPAAEQILELP
ncbi:MAG: Rne/Rng family ribonuclease [Myxococcota bacterium]